MTACRALALTRLPRPAYVLFACLAMLVLSVGLNPALPSSTPDGYETDDTFSRAKPILLNGETQIHNFHDTGDKDWVMFYGIKNKPYEIETIKPGKLCDTVIDLYDSQRNWLADSDDTGPGEAELLNWPCTKNGVYYLRIRQYDPAVSGDYTRYELQVNMGIGSFGGLIQGKVLDAATWRLVRNAGIQTDGAASSNTGTAGVYAIWDTAGQYNVTAKAAAYKDYKGKLVIRELETSRKDILIVPLKTPDLVVTALSGPLSANRGDSIEVTNAVANQGANEAGPFRLGIYLSKDERIAHGEDRLIKIRKVDGLLASGKSLKKTILEIPSDADMEPGAYYLGAIVDFDKSIAEAKEGNNTRTAAQMIQVK